MELSPMRYKDFVWPHNPETYTIEYERFMGNQKVAFGRYHLQDLGLTRRVLKGEGAFTGGGASDLFRALATVFYSEGPGILIHPVWQTASAYFVELSLSQEPRRDYVKYAFTFWEDVGSYDGQAGLAEVREEAPARSAAPGSAAAAGTDTGAVWYKVKKGESLWKIARDHGVELTQIIALNPQIKNPNLIYIGQEVRLK